jgi:Tol biopolymer transport system component
MNNKSNSILLTNTVLVFVFLISPLFLKAQFYTGSQLTFGKNRVQYGEEILWSFYRFEKFDVYFYTEGKELAEYAAKYATDEIKKIENKLEFDIKDKIQFVVFNKLTDLKESNIGLLSDDQYNIGGITHIVGKKVIIYYSGDHEDYERQIRQGIANIAVNQMLYGTGIGSNIKNTTLLNLPDWYLKGLISYLSEDWNTDIDNYVRDGILSGRYSKFNKLEGIDAIYSGHSIWKYIAEKYGEQNIPNIVYMSKVSRNIESAFLIVIGPSFKNLVKDWLNYFTEIYSKDVKKRQAISDDFIQKKLKKKHIYKQLKLSPTGQHVAFTTNIMGKYKVWIRDLNTGKVKPIMKHGHKLDEKVDLSYPLLAWHPTGQLLSIIIERKGKIFLYQYLLDDKKMEKRELFTLEKVLDFAHDDYGQKLVMSAVNKGQTDIFVFNLASNTYDRLTNDIFDDLNPRFINGGSDIVFSSNRKNDTIVFDVRTNQRTAKDTINLVPFNDLFIYNYKKKSPILKRITQTKLVNETQPTEYQDKYIAFLSDQNGITNRYVAKLDSVISYIDTVTHYRYFSENFQVTNYTRGILEQDISTDAGKIAEVVYSDGHYKMYINEINDASSIRHLKSDDTPYLKNLKKKRLALKNDTAKEEKKTKQRRRRLTTVFVEETVPDSNKIDINNYQFGDISQKVDSLAVVNANKKSSAFHYLTFPKQRNYNVEYSITQLVNQIDFSFLNASYQPFTGATFPIYLNPGFNALFKIGAMDLLEDYRITGGVRLSMSFDENEYLLSFENLKNRLDKQILFHRNVLKESSDIYLIKHNIHELHYILKYPFNNVLSIRGTATARSDYSVNLAVNDQNLEEGNRFKTWGGLKGELVFDNTRPKGINLYYGTRYKLFGEYFKEVDNKGEELFVVGLDYRHYQKIHKTFIWANRFAASSSFGKQKLIYYMGGVDNWLWPKFNEDINVDQNQNYIYQTIATNMRGFSQNIRNGNSFFVVNSELRFPVFNYFSNKPVKSEFLNSFQIVGFGDIGTAWTGLNPYSEDNSLYTSIVQQYPVTVTIKTQREPIVAGYGVGVRGLLFGYYIRADWAWGIEDGVTQPNVFYLSFSLDF